MVIVLQNSVLMALLSLDFLQYVGLCLVLGDAEGDATLHMQPRQPFLPPW